MTKKAIVCCGARDESMLPIFTKRWNDIYPDVELWLGDDATNPVTIKHRLPIVKITWGNGVAKSIINAMLETGGDIVAKLDVDAWHLKGNLFDPFEQSWVMASGHQWQNQAGRFLGIAYAIKREALLKITISQSCDSMRGNQEDTAMSQAVRRAYPNGVYLFPFMQCRRADTWNGEDASLIHCGLYGHSEDGRELAYDELVRLSKGKSITVKESAVIGMSVMPSRLHGVSGIIDELNSGNVKPKNIVLSIPHEAGRVEESYDESDVKKLAQKATVFRMDDLGPITKYVGLCEQAQADDLCIVLDDDRHYSPQLAARMAAEYKEGNAMANSVFNLYNTNIPEGYGAVIFRRSLIDLPKLKRLIYFLNEHFTEALLADDAVIGWFFKSQGVTVSRMKKPVYNRAMPATYDDSGLRKIKGGHIQRYQRVLRFLNDNQDLIAQVINKLT